MFNIVIKASQRQLKQLAILSGGKLPGDFFDSLADDLESQYPCKVKLQLPRPKVSAEHKREVNRRRVARWRAAQK